MAKKGSEIEWLYPDLLSKEGLIQILKQRYINKNGSQLESLDKESLVDLYNQYILPMPQRKYLSNRRGREMTKRQILHMKKRKISMTDEDEQSTKKPKNSTFQETGGHRQGLVNHFSGDSSSGSRLKPPPSCINFDKKVVKLGSKSKSPSSVSSAASSSQPSPAGDKKMLKLKSPRTNDEALRKIKRLKLDNDVKQTNQKVLAKITWP